MCAVCPHCPAISSAVHRCSLISVCRRHRPSMEGVPGGAKTSSPPTVGSKRTTHRLNEAVVSDACRPIRCSSAKEAFSQIPLAVILSSSHSRAGLRRAASRRRVPAPAHPRVGLAHLVVHPSFDGQQPRPPHAAQAAQTRQTFLRVTILRSGPTATRLANGTAPLVSPRLSRQRQGAVGWQAKKGVAV